MSFVEKTPSKYRWDEWPFYFLIPFLVCNCHPREGLVKAIFWKQIQSEVLAVIVSQSKETPLQSRLSDEGERVLTAWEEVTFGFMKAL